MENDGGNKERPKKESPKGRALLRTVAMPADTNPAGDIFGGWIMSQMDIAGGIIAKEISCSRVVTVAVDSMVFIKPVHVGDVVCCYGDLLRIGKTSITINLEVWVTPAITAPVRERGESMVTKAAFTYVSVDENGTPKTIQRACM